MREKFGEIWENVDYKYFDETSILDEGSREILNISLRD